MRVDQSSDYEPKNVEFNTLDSDGNKQILARSKKNVRNRNHGQAVRVSSAVVGKKAGSKLPYENNLNAARKVYGEDQCVSE